MMQALTIPFAFKHKKDTGLLVQNPAIASDSKAFYPVKPTHVGYPVISSSAPACSLSNSTVLATKGQENAAPLPPAIVASQLQQNQLQVPRMPEPVESPPPVVQPEKFVQGTYKTELCTAFKETGTCAYGDQCQFAHGLEEMRPRDFKHLKYKTRPCKNFQANHECRFGSRCRFLHDEQRLPVKPGVTCLYSPADNLLRFEYDVLTPKSDESSDVESPAPKSEENTNTNTSRPASASAPPSSSSSSSVSISHKIITIPGANVSRTSSAPASATTTPTLSASCSSQSPSPLTIFDLQSSSLTLLPGQQLQEPLKMAAMQSPAFQPSRPPAVVVPPPYYSVAAFSPIATPTPGSEFFLPLSPLSPSVRVPMAVFPTGTQSPPILLPSYPASQMKYVAWNSPTLPALNNASPNFVAYPTATYCFSPSTGFQSPVITPTF